MGRRIIANSLASSYLQDAIGGSGLLMFQAGLNWQTALSPDAHVAQLVEHILGKDEVTSSILVMGSIKGMNLFSKQNEPTNKK